MLQVWWPAWLCCLRGQCRLGMKYYWIRSMNYLLQLSEEVSRLVTHGDWWVGSSLNKGLFLFETIFPKTCKQYFDAAGSGWILGCEVFTWYNQRSDVSAHPGVTDLGRSKGRAGLFLASISVTRRKRESSLSYL